MRLAKYNVYTYIVCITDQSNWCGPFSLVVTTPDLESNNLGSQPGLGIRLEVFIYRSISPPTTNVEYMYFMYICTRAVR